MTRDFSRRSEVTRGGGAGVGRGGKGQGRARGREMGAGARWIDCGHTYCKRQVPEANACRLHPHQHCTRSESPNLQQILTVFNVGPRNLASVSKVDSNELALRGGRGRREGQEREGKRHPNYPWLYTTTLWLTKREELSFLIVLALPNASSTGLASMTWSSRFPLPAL